MHQHAADPATRGHHRWPLSEPDQAAKLMRAGKSTFYRHMRALGVPRRPQRTRGEISDVIVTAPRK